MFCVVNKFPLAYGVYLGYNLGRFGRIAQLVRALLSHSNVFSTVL
jgi:hypothetical protein